MNKTLRELLTKRQFQVCGLLAEGLQDKEIAVALRLSPKTISQFVSQCRERAGVNARVKLCIRYALEQERGLYEGTE